MFPFYLKKALRQGLYKEYHKQNYNDSNVRGTIDINRHLGKNIPFISATIIPNVIVLIKPCSLDHKYKK